MVTCAECGGLKEIQDMQIRQHGRWAMLWAICPTCKGTGRQPAPLPVSDPEKRAAPFDGPLTDLVRAGWASATGEVEAA
jgi:hypothetical protein